jgi:metal-dependent amidase/aminoacylase/carboxypeptidase family protein
MEKCRQKFASHAAIEVAEGPLEDRGSEDASWLIRRVSERGGRGTYIVVGADLKAGHHMEAFDFDEASLQIAVDLLTQLLDD